ncbi:MAG: pseudaminic acid cytidylyltransferase [Candidatus Eremiobacterota bacterium]
MNNLAIIPARGGSKRIPRKNVKSFLGVPIIKYSIDAALNADCFHEVMVSTDDKEIAEIAVSYGAKVPFYRSEATSNDYAGTSEVIEEVIMEYKKRGQQFAYFCCIYPTAPFITSERLREAMKLLKESGANGVLPVTRFSYPIQRSLKIEDGRIKMIWPENYNARSQDLMPAYHDCGQFYCLNIESFLKQKRLFAEFTIPIVIPETEVQDIDNEVDWKLAELKYRFLKNL